MRHLKPKWIAMAIVALTLIGATQIALASGDGAGETDATSSILVREPAIESVGINAVPEEAEARLSEDVRDKVSAQADVLASCYALHAAGHPEPEAVVTVDWTISTSGKPMGFTAFTSIDSLESCIQRTLSDVEFAHVDDTRPRARARLRFQ